MKDAQAGTQAGTQAEIGHISKMPRFRLQAARGLNAGIILYSRGLPCGLPAGTLQAYLRKAAGKKTDRCG